MPELAKQIRQAIDGCCPPVTLEEIQRTTSGGRDQTVVPGGRPRGERLVHVAAVMALLLGVAGVSTWIAVGRHNPAPRHIGNASNTASPHWRLTASLSSAQFQLGSGNPGSVSEINCGGGTTCFLSTFYGVGGNTALTGATYVSHDAGHTWGPTTLPAGVATATPVSCVNSSWCAAGGGLLDPATGDPAAKKEMRDPELLITDDGGASWSAVALPIPPDVQQLPAYGSLPAETTYWPAIVDAVDCTAIGVCDVVAHVLNNNNAPGGLIPDTLIFLRTTDGGSTWAQTDLPERSSEAGDEEITPGGSGAALACPTATSCIVMTTLAGDFSSNQVVEVWRTSDNGRSWQEASIPGVTTVYSGLSCPDAENCWAATGGPILHSRDGGATWSVVRTPPTLKVNGVVVDSWSSIACTSSDSCYLGGPGIEATTDAGKTWSAVPIPAGVGSVQSVACEPPRSCIALANPVLPPGQTLSPNGSSLVLTDGASPTS
jgi:hypothetical protein